MTVLLIRTPGVAYRSDIYTFLNTVSAAPHWVPASFLSKANLHLAFASALRMCVFQVCLLSMVFPRYVSLSVCCSSVSSNIIFMDFDLVDKVNSVVKDLVLLILTHQSYAQLDNMMVASWSRILAVVAYSFVLHRTKSSALHWGWTYHDKVVDEY